MDFQVRSEHDPEMAIALVALIVMIVVSMIGA